MHEALLTNNEIIDILGIPKLISKSEAKKLGHNHPLIYNRDGCHRWQPELFPEDDPRHDYTWQDCHNDDVALLGSEEAVEKYVQAEETGEVQNHNVLKQKEHEELLF